MPHYDRLVNLSNLLPKLHNNDIIYFLLNFSVYLRTLSPLTGDKVDLLSKHLLSLSNASTLNDSFLSAALGGGALFFVAIS